MKIEDKGKAIELLYRSIPYSDQIEDVDLEKDGVIYFTWRSDRYRLELDYCQIDRSNGAILEGNDTSILMTQLLKNNLAKEL